MAIIYDLFQTLHMKYYHSTIKCRKCANQFVGYTKNLPNIEKNYYVFCKFCIKNRIRIKPFVGIESPIIPINAVELLTEADLYRDIT